MHIALTADPVLPVPPLHYGGIERIIDMLAKGLIARNHTVTLFAHPDSVSPAGLVSWPGSTCESIRHSAANSLTLMREVQNRDIDIIHSFSRIAYLLPLIPKVIPKLMSYQRPISRRSVHLANLLARGSLEFSAISSWMIRPVQDIGRWHMVPNGVDLATYPFKASVALNAPLMFLGRLEQIKGPHLAIELAQRLNQPLIIAGNIPQEHQSWFDEMVSPHLNEMIRYVGPVNDQQKAALLGQSRALLMPILWDEPFGIVMAEALACGTPVLGLRRGAVPEVVEHGVSGFVVDDLDELMAAVAAIPSLERSACRARVQQYFSESAVTEGYLSVYRSLLCRTSV